QYGALLVAPCLEDFAVLRGAGLAVTTAHGLSDMTPEQLAAIVAAWPVGDSLPVVDYPSESSLSAADCDGDADSDGAGDPQPDQEESAENVAESSPPAPPVDPSLSPELVVVAWQVSRLSREAPENLFEVCL